MHEVYEKWEPIENIAGELVVDAVHDDIEGLRIIMLGNEPGSATLRISFGGYYAYRNADESYRLKLWEEFPMEDRAWQFFSSRSSEFIDWVWSQSGEIYDKGQTIHYLIKTRSDVFEIIADVPPTAEWLLSNR